MRPIGNVTKLRLVMGGGERLEGHAVRMQSVSATTLKSGLAVDKAARAPGAAGFLLRPTVC